MEAVTSTIQTVFSLQSVKAWAALVGAILTAVIATVPDSPTWLKVSAAVLTAVATWVLPNQSAPPTEE